MQDTYAKFKKIFNVLSEEYPGEIITNLNFNNEFELLIATILSAQCTDSQVNKISANLFQKYKTPEEFAALTHEELAPFIKGCGLYKNKSKNIIETSRILVNYYSSQVPDNFEDLVQLPGVGRKTANVLLGIAFGQPVIPVDTHVFRVSRQLGLACGNTPESVEKELINIVPADVRLKFHYILIMHGRKVCRARAPQCNICSVNKYCTSNRR